MIRVIKLGGSLLTLPDWHERLLKWLSAESPATNLLLVGGGELVDCLRREQQRFPYTDRQMHFAALAAMEIHAQLALARLPMAGELNSPDKLPLYYAREARNQASLLVVRINAWWNAAVTASCPLPPETWDTTSDTLAAWVAGMVEAEELVLLKSAPPPAKTSDWGPQEYIDANFFQILPKQICYRAENLRSVELKKVPCS